MKTKRPEDTLRRWQRGGGGRRRDARENRHATEGRDLARGGAGRTCLAQVHRRFCVPASLKHAAGARHQRQHVAGPVEILRFELRVAQQSNGASAIRGGGPRRGAYCCVARDSERRLVPVAVVSHHGGQAQLGRALPRHGDAQEAVGVLDHEGARSGRGKLRGQHEIPLILARLVIHHHDELAGSQRSGSGRHRRPRGRGRRHGACQDSPSSGGPVAGPGGLECMAGVTMDGA